MQPKFYGAAAEYNQPAGFQPNKRWLIVGGLVVLIITVIMVTLAIFTAIANGPSRDVATLVARESDFGSVLDQNREGIHSGDLNKINAEAEILLVSDSATLTGFMNKRYNLSKIPADVLAAETDSEIENELKDAEQIGRFDKTYSEMMQTKVAACLALAQKVLNASGSADFRAALEQNIENLKSIDDQLAELKL